MTNKVWRQMSFPLFFILLVGVVMAFTPVTLAAKPEFHVQQFKVEDLENLDTNEIIVKYKEGVGGEDATSVKSAFDLNTKYQSLKGFEVLEVPAGESVGQVIQALSQNKFVKYAEPNSYAQIAWTPNDQYFSYQWHYDSDHYNMPSTWNYSRGGSSGVTVAILDTGIAYENYGPYYKAPDLANANFTEGYDFINNDKHPNDDNGHGTHVTGTVAQSTNNSIGVAGIAFNTTIMPVKVLNSDGNGTMAQIADGMYFACDNGARVLNMSLRSTSPSDTLRDALDYCTNKGVLVFAATGNDYLASLGYPAAYSNAIAIGATDYNNQRPYYSNYGSNLDLVAPGGDTSADLNGDGYPDGILQQTFQGAYNNFDYYFFQGTSMATPHAVGAAALLLAKGAPSGRIESILKSTARTDMAGYNVSEYGSGLISPVAAFQSDYQAPSEVSNFRATSGNGQIRLSWTNPNDADYASTKIYRDGAKIYESTGTTHTDTGLNNGQTYTYAAITIDTKGNYSSGTSLTATSSGSANPISIITGAGPTGGPHVRAFDPDGFVEPSPTNLFAYATNYRGGVRVATGDIDTDGKDEIITGTGEDGGPHLRVFEKDGTQRGIEFFPFSPSFRGGMDVASGDFDGDGKDDIAVSQFSKGQAWVKVYRYNVARTILFENNVFGSAECGATIAMGDVDQDGRAELIVGAGHGGGPQIRVFDYDSNHLVGIPKPIQFFAFHPDSRTGIDVAAGDVDGDGKVEIAASQLKNGQAWVKVYKYNSEQTVVGNWNAFGSPEVGANVDMFPLYDSTNYKILVGSGPGGGPQVRGFNPDGSAVALNFFAYDTGFRGGVDMAGGWFN